MRWKRMRSARRLWVLALAGVLAVSGLGAAVRHFTRGPGAQPARAKLVLFIPDSPGERRSNVMSVVKVLELVGTSETSWQEAVANAVHEAARTIQDIRGVEVTNLTADVVGERIVEYKADVKIAFAVNSALREGADQAVGVGVQAGRTG